MTKTEKLPAYIIAEFTIHDPDAFARYRELATPIVQKYGGQYLARGGESDLLEGENQPKRVVILQFGSKEALKEFYYSEEYAVAKAVRQKAATGRMITVEGYAGP